MDVLIKGFLEMYAITKEDKYLKFVDDFIDCKGMQMGQLRV